MAESGYTKRAVRQDDGGRHLVCGCGRRVPLDPPKTSDQEHEPWMRCACGLVYDQRGWIQGHEEALKPTREQTAAKARELWAAFDRNQQAGVRFGLFPAEPMQAAEGAGFDGRLLAVALMDCATRDGGMRA